MARRVAAGTLVALFLTTAVTAHDPIAARVTWEREIAPIVRARCVSCHQDGGRAPMSLATYAQARPWARAIREQVLARRMPRWQVVRGYGDFSNDPTLSPFEIALITAWVDGGALRSLPQHPVAASPVPAALPTTRPPARNTRVSSVPCDARTLPAGRLLAVEPSLGAGASLRIDVAQSGALIEPLIWIKAFDPEFTETYWLRNPLDLGRQNRVTIAYSGSCSIRLTYEAPETR